jgi:hypothetical protein
MASAPYFDRRRRRRRCRRRCRRRRRHCASHPLHLLCRRASPRGHRCRRRHRRHCVPRIAAATPPRLASSPPPLSPPPSPPPSPPSSLSLSSSPLCVAPTARPRAAVPRRPCRLRHRLLTFDFIRHGRTDKNLCRCFGAPARRVLPDHLITLKYMSAASILRGKGALDFWRR